MERRARKALNLIARLPRTSHYTAEVLLDTEVAEKLAAAEDPDAELEQPTPRLTEWTPEVERLTLVADRISEVTAVLIAVNSKGGRLKPPRPLARPVTALDEARRSLASRLRAAAHAGLMRHLYPNQ